MVCIRRATAFAVCVLLVGLVLPVSVLASAPAPHVITRDGLDPFMPDHMPGSLLIGLRGPSIPFVHLTETDTLVRLDAGMDSYEERTSPTTEREDYARLLADPRVAFIEPNYRMHITQVPNDPLYSRQYWTRSVNLEPAWDITTGSPNITIAIVDAGVYADHPDLRGRVLPGYNYVSDNTNTQDDSSIQHGTAVTLLAAGMGNDGYGQAGVAWNVKILPVKAVNSNGDSSSRWVAQGMHWAVDHGATVINLSLGGPNYSQTVANEIAYAKSKNVTMVAAAGNEPTERDYPADDPNVITVGATDASNNPADFTSVVNKVDVAAPGASIPILLPEIGNDPISKSGTSFSAPIVSGIVALMQSVRPGIRPDEVLSILKNTARDIGVPGPDAQSGAGLVDANKAVRALTTSGGAPQTQQASPTPYAATYTQYDGPVLSGAAKRGFIWGPQVNSARAEPYAESPGGQRQVWYFDKGRLELNNPQVGQITSGLLAKELITGQVQTGDTAYETRSPANVAVAGDLGAQRAITYATMNTARGASPRPIGSTIAEALLPDGSRGAVAGDPSGVTTAILIPETNHTIASVFWNYLNGSGPTIRNGQTVNGRLFDPWYFVVGLPITEPYWITATVGGAPKAVLVQAFERRVLTYTPSNPDPFRVEMGNVGLQYVAWRYGQ